MSDKQSTPNAPTALIVEDEVAYCEVQRYNLESEGYRVITASDGLEALTKAKAEHPDVIILDWMLPELSGLEVCQRLRKDPQTRNVPIIMLTAKSEENDRIAGLDTGADDYIVKSSSTMSELMARVRALMRRAGTGKAKKSDGKPSDNIVRIGDIRIDRVTIQVSRAGKELHLKPTEYRLLNHLANQPGRVFTRAQLLYAVWGENIHVEERTVDVHVGRLRRVLKQTGLPDPIRTVRSIGYALKHS